MRRKEYTVRTKLYPTISGYQHVIILDGTAVAGFQKRQQADRFAKLLNQDHEPCHCDVGGE